MIIFGIRHFLSIPTNVWPFLFCQGFRNFRLLFTLNPIVNWRIGYIWITKQFFNVFPNLIPVRSTLKGKIIVKNEYLIYLKFIYNKTSFSIIFAWVKKSCAKTLKVLNCPLWATYILTKLRQRLHTFCNRGTAVNHSTHTSSPCSTYENLKLKKRVESINKRSII